MKHGGQMPTAQEFKVELTKKLFEIVQNTDWPVADRAALVEFVIAHGADVHATDQFGRAALHYANHAEVAKVLCKNGADLDAIDIEGNSVFHLAKTLGRMDVVDVLVSEGVNPMVRASYPDLHEMLSSQGEDTPVTKDDLNERLFKEVRSEKPNAELMSALLRAGANYACYDAEGKTPMHYASAADSEPALKALFGAHFQNVLHANNGNIATARGANALKALTNIQDTTGKTPLHYAISKTIVDALCLIGADVSATDHLGRTALHYAKTAEVAKALCTNLADVNAQDNFWCTPLHFATFEVAEALCDHGANIKAADKMGVTPIAYASSTGDLPLVALLMTYAPKGPGGHGMVVATPGVGCDPIEVMVRFSEDFDHNTGAASAAAADAVKPIGDDADTGVDVAEAL